MSVETRKQVYSQQIKRRNVDTGMCDRFVEIWSMSGLNKFDFAKKCGLTSPSSLIEIKNHITEPSKKMIMALYESLDINPSWILIGYGEKVVKRDHG
jgi:transcriptional regulator with XRE-family HTH domain